MSTSALLSREAGHAHEAGGRLLVTVRRPNSAGIGRYFPLGFLSHTDDLYRFSYLRSAVQDSDFRPIFGFGQTDRVYESHDLFPIFGERIMSARRPERPAYLRSLNLDDDSEPWEILGRSGGRRTGDTIEVIPEPVVAADGSFAATFLVHGIRHRDERNQAQISALRQGDRLILEEDPTNEANCLAVKVLNGQRVHLGFVPDPLAEFVCRALPSDPEMFVVQANGPETPPHLRLLVRLEGSLPAGERAFQGTDWETF